MLRVKLIYNPANLLQIRFSINLTRDAHWTLWTRVQSDQNIGESALIQSLANLANDPQLAPVSNMNFDCTKLTPPDE